MVINPRFKLQAPNYTSGKIKTMSKINLCPVSKRETSGLNKLQVTDTIKETLRQMYPGLGDGDVIILSQAPNGRVFDNPITFLFETKTPQQTSYFIEFARLVESLELELKLKYRVRFITQQKSFSSIKLFTGVEDFLETIGVEAKIED